MMGRVVEKTDPVQVGTIAVLALSPHELSENANESCIRCGRCMDVCPVGLPAGPLTHRPSAAVLRCIECGACEYACPAQRPLVSMLRRAKAETKS